ncbi:MAG: helix-turn-helix transcriptional regulator [Lentisphaeria bacterium]|nr:helix-turn-helix transcriptional regulator [Lentisphaeria bacterium]
MKSDFVEIAKHKGIYCHKSKGNFFEEKNYFRISGDFSGNDMLNFRSFGESEFHPGCNLSMCSAYWVFQVQIAGNAAICCNNSVKTLSPGDLLAIPPNVKYSYSVTGNSMKKFFITMHHSIILDTMLLNEVEKNGIFIQEKAHCDFQKLFSEIQQAMFDLDDEKSSVLLYQLIYRIRKSLTDTNQPVTFRQKLKNAVEKIDLMTSLDALAAEFNMPKHTLIRTFQRELGTTPISYMISMRLEYAKQLLIFSELNISEIATACGYTSMAFFTSEFRRKYSLSPGKFRKKYSS